MSAAQLGRALGAPLIAVVCLATPLAAAPDCRNKAAIVTEFGKHYSIGKRLTPAAPRARIPLARPGVTVRYVRLLIKPSALDPGWKLIIRDQRLRPLQVVDARNFTVGRQTVWSDRLPTSAVDVSLVFDRDLPGFFIDLPSADAMPESAQNPYYSTKSDIPDWEEVYTDDFGLVAAEVRSLGESVGMLTSFAGSSVTGFPTWCCSGSIIATSPVTLFLTNFHCGGLATWSDEVLWQGSVCPNTIIDMSWDGDGTSMEYTCKRVVRLDRKLDAAVLEIVPLAHTESPALPVKIRSAPLTPGETLRMIHHPQCLSKRVSQGCVAGASLPNWRDQAVKTDFAHRCDSEGGSSGAPVFDGAGNFVGLHHLGFELNAAGQCDDLNKAVSASPLIEFLRGLPVQIRD